MSWFFLFRPSTLNKMTCFGNVFLKFGTSRHTPALSLRLDYINCEKMREGELSGMSSTDETYPKWKKGFCYYSLWHIKKHFYVYWWKRLLCCYVFMIEKKYCYQRILLTYRRWWQGSIFFQNSTTVTYNIRIIRLPIPSGTQRCFRVVFNNHSYSAYPLSKEMITFDSRGSRSSMVGTQPPHFFLRMNVELFFRCAQDSK